MEKKRVLLITQEIEPYTEGTVMSSLIAKLPKFLSDNGYELRILMPRYSCVNERRHRLHEVVRLSGMNIIVDDDDYPLIIKVASLPNSRLQVYFLDNEEFFKRPSMFGDETPFEDNADRAAFFCKGAIEIVKKFGWAPDIILCEGWMTGLIPLYLKTAYKTEPLFANAEIVFGLFASEHEQMSERFFAKAAINNLKESDLEAYRNPDGTASINRGASTFSDCVIVSSESIDINVDYLNTEGGKTVQPWPGEEAYLPNTLETFRTLLEVPVEG
jgi:starch synthase